MWPLEPHGIREFCEGLDTVLIVEENENLLNIRLNGSFIIGKKCQATVNGKQDEFGAWLLPAENDLPIQTIVEASFPRLHKVRF